MLISLSYQPKHAHFSLWLEEEAKGEISVSTYSLAGNDWFIWQPKVSVRSVSVWFAQLNKLPHAAINISPQFSFILKQIDYRFEFCFYMIMWLLMLRTCRNIMCKGLLVFRAWFLNRFFPSQKQSYCRAVLIMNPSCQLCIWFDCADWLLVRMNPHPEPTIQQ